MENYLHELIDRLTLADADTEQFLWKGSIGSNFGKAIYEVSQRHRANICAREAHAWGLVGELYMSHVLLDYPLSLMRSYQYTIKEHIGAMTLDCKWYQEITNICVDKNNPFLLPNADGEFTQLMVDKDLIIETLDFCRESLN